LGGGDTGIDLVGLTQEGDYWAIQCKCFRETAIIDKAAVDSFLSTSSREFKNEDLKTARFSQRLWISTTNKWGPNAEEAIRNQNPPVTRINLYDLIEAPLTGAYLENLSVRSLTGKLNASAGWQKMRANIRKLLKNS
jgi:predicted helicase